MELQKTLNIDYLINDDYDEFLDFDSSAYPKRESRKEYYNYYYKNSENNKYNILIAKFNNKIVGQFKFLPNVLNYKGIKYPGIFGTDLYVDEKARRTLAGIFLINKFKKDFKYYFSVGANKTGTLITQSLGLKKIGEIEKFFWFRKISCLYKYSKVKKYKDIVAAFPDDIQSKNLFFRKEYNVKYLISEYMNSNVLSFNRDAKFINWRLNSPKNNYHNYFTQVDESYAFFSARFIRWRGLRLIVIMDYSYNNLDSLILKEILTASKKLAKEITADGVMFPSSLSCIDKMMRKNHFYKIGNPTNILSAFNFKFDEDSINKRKTVFATFADADSFLIN